MAAFCAAQRAYFATAGLKRRALGSPFGGAGAKRLRGFLAEASRKNFLKVLFVDFKKSDLYKSTFDLTVYIEECYRNFKRSDKYTIGGELRTLFNDFLIKVSTFNDRAESEKAAFCDELLKDLDKCQIKMTLCQELSVFKSYKSWYHAAEMLFDIYRQCEKHKNHFEGPGQNQRGKKLL